MTTSGKQLKENGPLATHEGIISITAKKIGYVKIEGIEEDILITDENLGVALNRDTVKIEVLKEKLYDRQTGRVVEVLMRKQTQFVGVIEKDLPHDKAGNGETFVRPDNSKIHVDFRLVGSPEVKVNDKVLIELLPWTNPRSLPEGKLISIIGQKGDNTVEMYSIVLERGFSPTFPSEVEAEARTVKIHSEADLQNEIKKRRDFRTIPTCTIDPLDAKDFDDAISFQKLGDLPAPRPGLHFVYAILCDDESIYIGQTQDLRKRWSEHSEGTGANHTKKHKPKSIIHYEEYKSREEAVKREKDLKTGFGRKWLKGEWAAGRTRQAGCLFEIGVHIADVSHYLQTGTLLDKEAQKRGTSVYLVDRTIPMLPEILSNDLCSLNPNEEKLAFSAVFEMNSEGEVSKRWFGRTVIKSDKRFTYEEAQAILDSSQLSNRPIDPGDRSSDAILNSAGPFAEALTTLNSIAKKLQAERTKKGAISFERDEVKFELDQNGKPIRVYRKERFDAHKLVEDFMLLANREVASYINKIHKHGNNELPIFIYRIHDLPDSEKIAQLAIFVKALGYELPLINGQVTGKDLNALFKKIEGKAEEGMIKTAAIRSMAKAIYSTKNLGHYGLAFEYYTHFTSPIRRYPDTMVHRLMAQYLAGKKVDAQEYGFYEKMATQNTEAEIRASEAERESIKLKQVEYMQDKIGQIFDGIISGVSEWGMYVEENETRSEGMIRLKDLTDDYYTLDAKNYRVVGEKTKKKYALGDQVKFKIINADLDRKILDFQLV